MSDNDSARGERRDTCPDNRGSTHSRPVVQFASVWARGEVESRRAVKSKAKERLRELTRYQGLTLDTKALEQPSVLTGDKGKNEKNNQEKKKSTTVWKANEPKPRRGRDRVHHQKKENKSHAYLIQHRCSKNSDRILAVT